LLDQGVFQGLWSCCCSNNTLISSRELISLKPLIFQLIESLDLELLVIIYVSAPREIVINGLRTRSIKGSSALNSLQITEIEKGIRTTSNMLDAIHDIVASHPKIKVIEVPR
jgi:dephospho-CoA kinase